MFHVRRSWAMVIAAGFALTCTGCPSKPSPEVSRKSQEASRKPTGDSAMARADKKAAKDAPARPALQSKQSPQLPKPKPQAPPAAIPKVNLSGELRAGCLVNVGDTLPKAELPDLGGKMQSLDSLYGKKLTVVCLWTIGTTRRTQLEAADTLHGLTSEIVEPFAKKGVQVVGIEVGDTPDSVQQSIQEAAAMFPCLLDAKGDFYASLAKDNKMPRIFLLDAEGKILWFDIEYSRSTREDLLQGILAVLGEQK